MRNRLPTAIAVALLLGNLAPAVAHAAADPALLCEKAAGISLVSCVKKVAKARPGCPVALARAAAPE